MKFKKVLVILSGLMLMSGGVYAGTVIDQYKTPRGNIATVEKEEIHKNRIGVTVNGKTVKTDTWYHDSVSYIPLREVSTLLGATVNYNSKTMSAEIKSNISSDGDISKIKFINDLQFTMYAIGMTSQSANLVYDNLLQAEDAYRTNSSTTEFDQADKNLSNLIDMYNLQVEKWNDIYTNDSDSLTNADIEYFDSSLDSLWDTIEYLKDATSSLESYIYYNSSSDLNNFFSNLENASYRMHDANVVINEAMFTYYQEIQNY